MAETSHRNQNPDHLGHAGQVPELENGTRPDPQPRGQPQPEPPQAAVRAPAPGREKVLVQLPAPDLDQVPPREGATRRVNGASPAAVGSADVAVVAAQEVPEVKLIDQLNVIIYSYKQESHVCYIYIYILLYCIIYIYIHI